MITGQVKWADVAHYYAKSTISIVVGKFDHGSEMGMIFSKGMHSKCSYMDHGMWCEVSNGGFVSEWGSHAPILRHTSDMSKADARDLIQIFLKSDKYDPIEENELWFEIHRWDNAAMLDGDIAIHFSIATRCWDGELSICLNGDFQSSDAETGENYRVTNLMEMFHHLICKGFDLFGLIESGQAIRKEVENA